MGESDNIAIRTVDLAKSYPSGQSQITVFHDLNLQVQAGERVAIIGESGTGKSTLLHLLGGLDRPTQGEIYFGSKALSSLSDGELSDFRNTKIGFVWQSHSLLPEFSALENVMMPLLIRGASHKAASALAHEKLAQVGLEQREHHRAGELSGGEQQRVSLARALVSSPQVLLADEPTGSLDYRTGEGIITLLEDLHRSHKLTSVIVTHNLAFARRCDRVLSLDQGRLHPIDENSPPPPLEAISLSGANGSTYV
ncbi:MAG TPA: ABC transporter ATP-binding protein [Bryobacteraceae bacterium]|nr:ABC transporter ATP-binding protein [Bryobacteraceae bacterium]